MCEEPMAATHCYMLYRADCIAIPGYMATNTERPTSNHGIIFDILSEVLRSQRAHAGHLGNLWNPRCPLGLIDRVFLA